MIRDVISLIKELPEVENHIFMDEDEHMVYVTSEWLVGGFAGRSFGSKIVKESAEKLIEYFNNELESEKDSIVKSILIDSGWPNMSKVKEYCVNNLNE